MKGKVSLTRAEIANFQVKMGDIFFTRTSETIDEIGFPSVMLDEPKDTVFSGFVLRGRALQDDPLTLQFKRYVFFTDAFRKEMVKKSSITTRALTSGTAIKNMEFVFPKNKKEQEFIGNFFRHLDRLITLHQCNCNMATRPYEWSSGLRAIAWEQRKLGEIAEKTFGGGTPSTSNPDFWSGKIPWIQSSDLTEDNLFDVKPRKFISKLAIKSSASKIIPKNSIAIIVRVGVGKLAFLPFNYSTSQDFLSITEINVDELFALYSIYKKLKKDLSLVQGTSIKGITKEELLRKTLFIPIKKSEQARIGAFFRHLDRLITLHQRKHILLT